MEQEQQRVAFWLMPAADAKSVFTALIEELAVRFDAPVFEPHVTLQGAEIDLEHASELLDEIAATTPPLRLQAARVELSEEFTKTLYVQFLPSETASALSAEIASGAGGDSSYQFDPHLSLLYKAMPRAAKEDLAREIDVPLAEESFDAIALVSVPESITRAEDVHAWRKIAERRLTGAPR